MSKTSKNLKSFLLLSNVYYEKLMSGLSVSKIASDLSVEECIYFYNKHLQADDLKEYTGLIEKDEDIENNWYALSYAVAKYYNKQQVGHSVVDNYILKMASTDKI